MKQWTPIYACAQSSAIALTCLLGLENLSAKTQNVHLHHANEKHQDSLVESSFSVQSDIDGIRTIRQQELQLKKDHSLIIRKERYLTKDFQSHAFSRTREEALELTYRFELGPSQSLQSRFSSELSRQDLHRFSNEHESSQFQNRSYSLVQGYTWQNEGLHFEIFLGAALCLDGHSNDQRGFPLASFLIQREDQDFVFSLSAGRVAQGLSKSSAFYGSQYRDEIATRVQWQFSNRVSLNLDCSASMAQKVFATGAPSQTTPLLLANAHLSYQPNASFRASIGISASGQLGMVDADQSVRQRPNLASFNLAYHAF